MDKFRTAAAGLCLHLLVGGAQAATVPNAGAGAAVQTWRAWQAWPSDKAPAEWGPLRVRPAVAMAPRDASRPADPARWLPALSLGGARGPALYLIPRVRGGLLLMLQLTP